VQLAEKLGISQQTLQSYECRRGRVPVSAMPAVAQHLAVSLDELFDAPGQAANKRAPAKRGPAPKWQQQIEQIAVETKRFNEAVKRNAEKFPADFMFQLTAEEFTNLRSKIATSSSDGADTGHGGRRYLPRVFTEHGALMAATVLSSPRAVEVSIYVVRAFVQLRGMANTHQGLAKRLDALE